MKDKTRKPSKVSIFIIAAIITITLLTGYAYVATSTENSSDGKVESISNNNIPLSKPRALVEAQEIFENGKNISTASFETGIVTFNENLADKGIIGLETNVAAKTDLKVKVSKDGRDIFYDILPSEMIKIPMQMGNGVYAIELYENIEGMNYKQLCHKELDIQMADPNSVFLYSNQIVNFDNQDTALRLALMLTEDAKSDAEKLKAVYEYIISNIRYDYDEVSRIDASYIPDIGEVLSSSKGICYDYAAVMAALMREVGVPTKLVEGYRLDNAAYHAWNEVLVDGEWLTVDTTYDAASKQNGQSYEMKKNPDLFEEVLEY